MPASTASSSATTVDGQVGPRVPREKVIVPVALFVFGLLAYIFQGQITSAVPSLLPLIDPVLGLSIFALYASIVVFGKGPPDHLRLTTIIGMPGAILLFAVEGIGLYVLGWAGVLQLASIASGGLRGVPSPENWVIPTAGGVTWLGSSIVVVALTTEKYLLTELHERGKRR